MMFDQSVRDVAGRRPATLQLPLQTMPVERTGMRAGAVTDTVGVEADSWWDDVMKNLNRPMVATTFAGPFV